VIPSGRAAAAPGRAGGLRRRRAAWALAPLLVLSGVACRSEPGATPESFCEAVPAVRPVTAEEEVVGPAGQKRLRELIAALSALEAASPEPVRGDVRTMTEGTERLRAALAAQAGYDEAARTEAMAELSRHMAEFAPASRRVVAYTRTICGIDLESG
jgi:hypothetical protein